MKDPLQTNSCKNVFLEPDGFCTRCGQNHLKIREKQTRRVAVKAAPVAAPVYRPQPKVTPQEPADTLRTEIERVVRETVETLAELYETDVTLEFRYSRQGSYCKHLGKNKHQIVIGRTAEWFFENGYYSYRKNCQYTAMDANNGKLPQGMDAVRTHAAHEVAHAIVTDNGHPFEKHGRIFLATFKEVLTLVL